MTRRLTIHIPDELAERLDALIPEVHKARSDAVRRAVELYVYRLLAEEDVRRYEELPLTKDELALMNNPDAWNATPPW